MFEKFVFKVRVPFSCQIYARLYRQLEVCQPQNSCDWNMLLAF